MSANINVVLIAGNLTRDHNIKYSQNQNMVLSNSLAINKKYNDKDSTTFVEFVAFGKTAEILQKHTGKGQSVCLEGGLDLQQWNAQDGSKRSKLQVIANKVHILEWKDKPQEEESQLPYNDSYPDNDDIPF